MNIRIQYVILGIALWCANAAATVVTPKFEKDFNKLIDASNLAVVHFINYDLIDNNKEAAQDADDLMEDIEDVKEEFTDVADDEDFEGVRFIGVDLRALPDLADDYNITELSTIMLFKDGKPFKRRGEIVTLKGIVDSEEIDDFIMDHFEDFIEKLQAPTQAVTPTQRTVVYQPYEQRYYSRPYYGRTWLRPYWRRGYYGRFGRRPYYWRHGGRWGRWGGRRRGGFGFGVGFGGRRGRGWGGFGIGW